MPNLEQIARKATEYNPKNRYKNLGEMLNDLNPKKKAAPKARDYARVVRGVKKRVVGLITNLRRREETKKEDPNEKLLERNRLIRKLKEYFICLEHGWLNCYRFDENSCAEIEGRPIIELNWGNRETLAVKKIAETLDDCRINLTNDYILRIVWEFGRVSNMSACLSQEVSKVLEAYSRISRHKKDLNPETLWNIVENNVEIYVGGSGEGVHDASRGAIRDMESGGYFHPQKKKSFSRLSKWSLASVGTLFLGGALAAVLYTQTPDYRLSQCKQEFRTIQQLVEKGEYDQADELTDRQALKHVKESDSRVKELLIEIGGYDRENIAPKVGGYFFTINENGKGGEKISGVGYKKGQRKEVLFQGDIETGVTSPNEDLAAIISNGKLYLARFYGRDSSGFPKNLAAKRQLFDFEGNFIDGVFSDLFWLDNSTIRFGVYERGYPEVKAFYELDVDKNEYYNVTG